MAWKVNVEDLKDWDLDIKNPTQEKVEKLRSTEDILSSLEKSFLKSLNLIKEYANE